MEMLRCGRVVIGPHDDRRRLVVVGVRTYGTYRTPEMARRRLAQVVRSSQPARKS